MPEVQKMPQQSDEMPHVPAPEKASEPKGLLARANEKAAHEGKERKKNRVLGYFKEVRDELKKVEWPKRKQVIRGTLIVIGLGIFVAVILGAFDVLFEWILQQVLTIF